MRQDNKDTTTKEGFQLDWAKFWWEAAKGITVGIAAIFSFQANQQGRHNADTLEKIKLEASERAQQSQLDLKAYELVEKTLSLDAAAVKGHGIAAAAIINALTKPPLRSDLLNALRAGSKDEKLIRQIDDAQKFDLEEDRLQSYKPSNNSTSKRVNGLGQVFDFFADNLVASAQAQNLPNSLKGYKIDIFYCEASVPTLTDQRQNRAQEARLRLESQRVGVNVRVRLLPTLIQARPSYQSFADEIRFSDRDKERNAATQLASIVGLASENIRQIDFPSPGYISIFYCAD